MTTARSGPWTGPNPRTREVPATMPGCLVHGKPDPLLRDWVLGYVGFPPRTMLPPVSRFIPIGAVLLMLEFGPAPGELLTGDRRVRLPVQPVVGLRERSALVEPQPAHGLTIMLTPPGAHALFDVALRELTNTFTGAADLIGSRVPLLVERLAEITDWRARFALVDRTLADWLARGPVPAPAVTRAWRRLHESGGQMHITDLAAEVGTSRRYLEKRFGEQVGLAPKTVARIIRFEAVYGVQPR
jgi:AraC-like DNA-binding protein